MLSPWASICLRPVAPVSPGTEVSCFPVSLSWVITTQGPGMLLYLLMSTWNFRAGTLDEESQAQRGESDLSKVPPKVSYLWTFHSFHLPIHARFWARHQGVAKPTMSLLHISTTHPLSPAPRQLRAFPGVLNHEPWRLPPGCCWGSLQPTEHPLTPKTEAS